MDCNERYVTIDALIQSRIKANSQGITYLTGLSEYYTADVKGLAAVIADSNNALKKGMGEIVRLRRTIKNISKQYEEANSDLMSSMGCVVGELERLWAKIEKHGLEDYFTDDR